MVEPRLSFSHDVTSLLSDEMSGFATCSRAGKSERTAPVRRPGAGQIGHFRARAIAQAVSLAGVVRPITSTRRSDSDPQTIAIRIDEVDFTTPRLI